MQLGFEKNEKHRAETTLTESQSRQPSASVGRSLTAEAEFVPTGFRADRPSDSPPVAWQTAMKLAVRDSAELLTRLGLGDRTDLSRRTTFPTFVPLEFLSRMKPGDPEDPLLKQVLAVAREDLEVDGFDADPVGDLSATVRDSLLHKYDSRALLITTSACGVHCRYCFRREFPYQEAASRRSGWGQALAYLREHPEIDEVLLSGGDPLTLADGQLAELLGAIDAIDHVRRIRFHSRMPVVIPQRINEAFLTTVGSLRATPWMVIHCNHAAEIDQAVIDAIDRMVGRGIPVLNQAVLLRGVNDSVHVLEDLCRTLVDHRVQPYYLHQLDRVRGAAHFEVDPKVGVDLVRRLRDRLPGYAVPTYVQEHAGEKAKTVVP